MSVIQAITVSVFARTWLVLTSAHAHLDLNWMPITPRAEVTERVTELHISDGHHVKQNSKNKNWIFTVPSWECVTKFLLRNRNSFYIAYDVRAIRTKRCNIFFTLNFRNSYSYCLILLFYKLLIRVSFSIQWRRAVNATTQMEDVNKFV